jgi:hypothetical protein
LLVAIIKNENNMLRFPVILLFALSATSCSDYFAQEKLKNEQKVTAEKERLERIENAKKIDEENLKKSFTIQKTQIKPSVPNCTGTKGKVRIGMTKSEVLHCGWGKPERVSRTITATSTREQWIYSSGNYLYFDDDLLVTVQN